MIIVKIYLMKPCMYFAGVYDLAIKCNGKHVINIVDGKIPKHEVHVKLKLTAIDIEGRFG